MRQNIIKILLLTSSMVALTACVNDEKKTDVPNKTDAIAVIGDKEITQDDLNNQLVIESGTMTLQKMIIKDVILKELPKDKINEVKSEVGVILLTEKSKYKTEDEYNAYLRGLGYDNEEQLESIITNDKLISKYVESNLKLDKKSIEKSIDDNLFSTKIVARGIMVNNEDLANDIIKKLKDGESWDKLHDENNIDYTTYPNKGEFPPIEKENNELDTYKTPETVHYSVVEAVKSAKAEGLVEKPVVIPGGGYYVLELIFNGSMDGWSKHEDLIIEQYKMSFLNNNLYITSKIGELLKEYDIKINGDRYEHVLTGLYDTAGQFENIMKNPENMFQEADGIKISDTKVEEVTGNSDKEEISSEE